MKFTLLISSCDSYLHLLPNFAALERKYFKVDCPKIFVGETEGADSFFSILPGKIPWGARILTALEEVKTEYVIFVLDDYFFSRQIKEEELNGYISLIEKYNADKLILDGHHPDYRLRKLEETDLYILENYSMYLTSIQFGLHKTDFLKKTIKSHYTPWDYEILGSIEVAALDPKILLKIAPRPYFGALRRGQWEPGIDQFLEEEGLVK